MTRDADRVSIGLRLPRELHRKLQEESEKRDLAVNWLIIKAIEDFLPRLVPVEEFRLTRRGDS